MTPLEVKRLEVQLANVRAARLANELKVDELLEVIERLKKDIQLSSDKETEIELSIQSNKLEG